MERAALDNVAIEYEVAGTGEPVLLIHGSVLADGGKPLMSAPALAEDYRLIRYHRRGFAGSTHPLGPISMSAQASDADGSAGGTIFTLNPDSSGGPPHNGTVLKSGVPMGNGNSFSQADINNNLITYQNNGACDTNDDFQLGITDQKGGVWTNVGHTVFSFRMQTVLVDQPPVAVVGQRVLQRRREPARVAPQVDADHEQHQGGRNRSRNPGRACPTAGDHLTGE